MGAADLARFAQPWVCDQGSSRIAEPLIHADGRAQVFRCYVIPYVRGLAVLPASK